MRGPGKYDPELTAARESAKATSGILIIFGGDRGSGFAVQVEASILIQMPHLLRELARDIERDIATGMKN